MMMMMIIVMMIRDSRGTKARASVRGRKPPGVCGGWILEGAAKSRRKKCAVFERCQNHSNGRKTLATHTPKRQS